MGLYQSKRVILGLFAGLMSGIVIGCASAPQPKHLEGYSFPVAEKAAAIARAMIGKPYRYGGDSPSGFDCSGLVRYSYRSAGLDLPHGTGELRRQSRSVSSRELRKGDLVFFNQEGKKSSHVGIYTGGDHFIHAPGSGKRVRMDSLDDAYWKKHFVDGRRFY